MNATSLSFLHDPRSVAIVGASDDGDKVGGRPVRYLREFGFTGDVLPVNSGRTTVQGLPAYPSVSALPVVPDVALIAVPGTAAVEAVAACADVGVKACVVMAAGFGETDDADAQDLQNRMLASARQSGMRIVGPNSQGLANFGTGAVLGFSTMFAEQPPQDGPVAIISQSGAMCSVPYGLLRRRGIGVRYAHGTGNDADVTVGELAEAVLSDADVRLVLLYLEDLRDPTGLERAAATALEQQVPIVALMGGRSTEGKRAAQSHTGALASEQRVVDAFFDRVGIWRARSMGDIVNSTELYLKGWQPSGRDVVIVSNSGAVCVLGADAAADHGLPLARLSEQTQHNLDHVLPRFATKTNPVDITAALLNDSSLVGKVLQELSRDTAADACVIGIPVAGRGYDVPRFATDAATFADVSNKPLVVAAPQPAVAEEFRRAGLVVFDEEATAMAALAQFLRHHEVMAAARKRTGRLQRVELAGRDRVLNEADSFAILGAAGVPVVRHALVADPASARARFEELGSGPVALKGCTAEVTHKSELGLVRLGLRTGDDVEEAAADLLRTMADHRLQVDGLLLSPMVDAVREVLVGAHRDPVFGPVVVIGAGGKYVEALPDTQLLLPPFTADEVLDAISRLRMFPVLHGVRGEPAADVDAWAEVAVRVGDMMIGKDCRVRSLDANPVMLRAHTSRRDRPGALVVDAVVVEAGATQ
jgi:acyl-CoA synthetase (NDP forming)